MERQEAAGGGRASPVYPERCLQELFEAQAARVPAAWAVSGAGELVTYAELNRRANRLARRLLRLGVRPEARVGILAGRSPALVAALLGILKAGAAYVPLDPTYPTARLRHMAADAGIQALLGEDHLQRLPELAGRAVDLGGGWLEAPGEEANPSLAVTRENLAYVIYTSGSTGRPKGVGCAHRGVVNLLADFERRRPVGVDEGCSLWTSTSFDVSVWEIFAPLLAGARLCLVPEALRPSATAFAEWMAAEHVVSAYVPPFFLGELAAWLRQNPGRCGR